MSLPEYLFKRFLKGAAGNIGAIELADASVALERALHAGQTDLERIYPVYQPLVRQMRAVLNSIGNALHDLDYRKDAPYV